MLIRLHRAWVGGVLFRNKGNFFRKINFLFRDARERKFFAQRFFRGFSDDETWNLDYTFSCFILPRLKRFREVTVNMHHGDDLDEWNDAVGKMIFAMEKLATGEVMFETQIERDKIQEGCKLFGRYLQSLWW